MNFPMISLRIAEKKSSSTASLSSAWHERTGSKKRRLEEAEHQQETLAQRGPYDNLTVQQLKDKIHVERSKQECINSHLAQTGGIPGVKCL